MARRTIRLRAHWASRTVWVDGERLDPGSGRALTGQECRFEWGSLCPGAVQLAAAVLLKYHSLTVARRLLKRAGEGISEFPYGNFDVDMPLDTLLDASPVAHEAK